LWCQADQASAVAVSPTDHILPPLFHDSFIEQTAPQAVESVACVKKAKKRIDCNIFFEGIVEPFRAEYLCRRNKHFEDIGVIVYPSSSTI
jgi:hypothetical protein